MDTIKLCILLAEVTYNVYVTQGNRLLRYGSAVAISDASHLLTAAHVITGHGNLAKGAFDPRIQVFVRPARGYVQPYRVEQYAIAFHADYLSEPFIIDLALLAPVQRREHVAALDRSLEPVALGMGVLMAGFSHEIRPAFDFPKVKGLQADPAHLPDLAWLQQSSYEMMIKRGMIGQVTPFRFEGAASQIEGDWFHIDNMMHPGASGGPVVDGNGALVGIITHTARKAFGSLVDSPTFQDNVPSGSEIAISPRAAFSRPA